MKNLRKLFTLVLALMILVSVFTLPAMAATVEHECEAESEIQPRVPALQCDCGGFATYVRMQDVEGVPCYVLKCSSCGALYYLPRN